MFLYKKSNKLYTSAMTSINISSARENLPDAIEAARTEAVFLERYGRPVAVIVSPERYEQLLAALDEG